VRDLVRGAIRALGALLLVVFAKSYLFSLLPCAAPRSSPACRHGDARRALAARASSLDPTHREAPERNMPPSLRVTDRSHLSGIEVEVRPAPPGT